MSHSCVSPPKLSCREALGSEAWFGGTGCCVDSTILVLCSLRRVAHTPRTQACNLCQMWGEATQRHAPHPAQLSPPAAAAAAVMSGECCAPHFLHGGLPALYTSADSSLVACLPISQPEAPSAQVMDFLFEKWKLYSDECHHNLSLLPPPTGESPPPTVSCHPAWMCSRRPCGSVLVWTAL